MGHVEHQLTYAKGTRRAEAAQIAWVEKTGERHEISLEPLLRFQMKGIGYTHPEWGHGFWKGELAIGGESWKLDDLDPLAFGPHATYGFKDILDGAS